jgi:hypothetical protein
LDIETGPVLAVSTTVCEKLDSLWRDNDGIVARASRSYTVHDLLYSMIEIIERISIVIYAFPARIGSQMTLPRPDSGSSSLIWAIDSIENVRYAWLTSVTEFSFEKDSGSYGTHITLWQPAVDQGDQ